MRSKTKAQSDAKADCGEQESRDWLPNPRSLNISCSIANHLLQLIVQITGLPALSRIQLQVTLGRT